MATYWGCSGMQNSLSRSNQSQLLTGGKTSTRVPQLQMQANNENKRQPQNRQGMALPCWAPQAIPPAEAGQVSIGGGRAAVVKHLCTQGSVTVQDELMEQFFIATLCMHCYGVSWHCRLVYAQRCNIHLHGGGLCPGLLPRRQLPQDHAEAVHICGCQRQTQHEWHKH